ncbi:CD1247 N-terminal domain-containing protein, partial [Clostridium sporogenes]
MKSITSKVSYLKGLIEGLEVKEDSKEGKIIS